MKIVKTGFHIGGGQSHKKRKKQKSIKRHGKKKEKFAKRFLGKVCFQTIQMQKEMNNVFDKIEWVSVEEGKPCGYIVVDEETGYKEPAEYLVHVKGAAYPTVAMYLDGKFVPPCFYFEGKGGFVDEIDYWAEVPKWKH